jgi:hypothetical protein
MEQGTQTAAATAEECAAASLDLNSQADSTMTLVRELESMVGSVPVPAAAPATKAAARPASKLLAMRPRPARPVESADTLGDGTFGSF